VVNKVDKAAAESVILPDKVQKTFFKRVATCATQGVGLQELDVAILDLVGLGQISSEGQQWAVNQVSTLLFPVVRDCLFQSSSYTTWCLVTCYRKS
jgi:hypothetical protein